MGALVFGMVIFIKPELFLYSLVGLNKNTVNPFVKCQRMNIFSIPVGEKYILYAPLHHFLALVNRQATQELQDNLIADMPGNLFSSELIETLKVGGNLPFTLRDGALDSAFLGIIPTRGCNSHCRYCDFSAPKDGSPAMELSLARDAIDSYLLLKKSSGVSRVEIHFFGGEPFHAENVVQFSVEYATMRAAKMGMQVHFEVTTNGIYRPALAKWVADHFDVVVLSLDGPRDIQEAQRPAGRQNSAFDVVFNTARILSNGPAELMLRTCITNQTVNRMDEIARWFCDEFCPTFVCFETLTPTDLSRKAGLDPPGPWEFAWNFHTASLILAEHGISAIHATAETHTPRVNFCPLGKDALIVSPEGIINACYLLQENWERRGMDLCLGAVENGKLNIPPARLDHIHSLNVENRPLCTDCFCRYHCAGGCYVNHETSAPPGQFDALCIQTRLITIINLLQRLGQQEELIHEWLADRHAMETSVLRRTDRLCN
jgi:uncharacterized protein